MVYPNSKQLEIYLWYVFNKKIRLQIYTDPLLNDVFIAQCHFCFLVKQIRKDWMDNINYLCYLFNLYIFIGILLCLLRIQGWKRKSCPYSQGLYILVKELNCHCAVFSVLRVYGMVKKGLFHWVLKFSKVNMYWFWNQKGPFASCPFVCLFLFFFFSFMFKEASHWNKWEGLPWWSSG